MPNGMYFSNIFDDFRFTNPSNGNNLPPNGSASQPLAVTEVTPLANTNSEISTSRYTAVQTQKGKWDEQDLFDYNLERVNNEYLVTAGISLPTNQVPSINSTQTNEIRLHGRISSNYSEVNDVSVLSERNSKSKSDGLRKDDITGNAVPRLSITPSQDDDDDDERDYDDNDEDDDDESNVHSSPHVNHARKRKQELHRRHSKRYRDNIGELFQSLETLLPKVLPGCKLKTKSQIISNSVDAVVKLRAEVSSLEMQYVLSSPTNRTKWVEDIVSNASCFQEIAEPFMRLLLGMQRWKHSELWGRFEANVREDGTDSVNPVEEATNTIHDLGPIASRKFFLKLIRSVSAHDMTAVETPDSYKSFSRLSQLQTFIAGDDSLVGRIATSLSPEMIDLTDVDSRAAFKRGDSAQKCGFTVCFAVPILVRGHVFAAVLFFDDQQRSDVGPDMNIAQDLAGSLGNCYGAYTTKRESTSPVTRKRRVAN